MVIFMVISGCVHDGVDDNNDDAIGEASTTPASPTATA